MHFSFSQSFICYLTCTFTFSILKLSISESMLLIRAVLCSIYKLTLQNKSLRSFLIFALAFLIHDASYFKSLIHQHFRCLFRWLAQKIFFTFVSIFAHLWSEFISASGQFLTWCSQFGSLAAAWAFLGVQIFEPCVCDHKIVSATSRSAYFSCPEHTYNINFSKIWMPKCSETH